MMKALMTALATAGVVCLVAPAANAAPRLDGLTEDLSAQTTVVVKTNKRHHRHHRRTVVRTYPAPTYYGYYGPTYYDRPYHRPPSLVLGVGGWW
jgi:hypothetical protein